MGYRPSNPNAYGFGKIYTSREHYAVQRSGRADFGRTGVSFTIDTHEIEKLQKALREAGATIKKGDAILAQSLNRAGDRIRTDLKRAIQQWIGAKRQTEITKRMQPVRASPGNMRAGVVVSGRHMRITRADFGASWKRSWPGGRHSAWNRPQTAKGSFMIFKGRGSAYGGGILFTRTSKKRLPIKPLWGPHPVREIQRHEAYARAIVTKQARWFMGEVNRRTEAEFRRVKGKYGL